MSAGGINFGKGKTPKSFNFFFTADTTPPASKIEIEILVKVAHILAK